MADIIVFSPKAELDAAENLRGFVDSCKKDLTVFGPELPFDENVWDITEFLHLKGHGNKRHRLVFSTMSTVNDANPEPMSEPFLSFAKAYLRYMHRLRPTKITGFRLAALRALETALSENGIISDPINTDSSILNRATQLIAEHYSDGVAYRTGGQLEMVANFLSDNHLTVVPVRWRNNLKRPGDSVRVGKDFDDRREAKMPSEAALDALPKAFRLATLPVDIIVSSVAALMCASPDRISEVLMLPENCEVHQPRKGKDEAYGLRWWPAKDADPMIKWVVPSMAGVVQDAIAKIRLATAPARIVAKWYENNPHKIYLPEDIEYLRDKEWICMDELAKILGTQPYMWCKTVSLRTYREGNQVCIRFCDVETAMLRMLPHGFPVINKETGLKFSEALLVVRRNELGNQRGTYNSMIEAVTIGQINSGLGSRFKHGFDSIFCRLGLVAEDGTAIKVTTHQFRHYLNTLAQAGGMSQLDIAKWSGRKDIHQNAAYDHVTPDQMLLKIRDAVGDSNKMFGPLAEMPKRVLIPRDEFARLMVPTAHTTDLGFCIHDYTMSPCQLHMDCIHCEDLVCVKGDHEKAERLQLRLKEARALMEKAENAVEEGYAGSDRWLVHHKSAVERLSQLCSIMSNPDVPQGSIIQLAPPMNIESKKIDRLALTTEINSTEL